MDSPIQYKMSHGLCCSQTIMAQALETIETENPQLVDAMRGLCGGIQCGSICGALAAAQCVVCMLNTEEKKPAEVEELQNWFRETFGSLDCMELTHDRDPVVKQKLCPNLVEATYGKLAELLDW